MLDNIRSAHNVGAVFRTSDSAGIDHIYICGITPTPDIQKVAKTALGAEKTVSWSQHWNGVEVIKSAQENGKQVLSLECNAGSISLFDVFEDLPEIPTLLVLGNEKTGIDPEILSQCDQMICIPMMGQKKSLNVSVAFGIAVYFLLYGRGLSRSI